MMKFSVISFLCLLAAVVASVKSEEECIPADGSISHKGCPEVSPSRPDFCEFVKFEDEGCYYGDLADKTKPYPKCCTKYGKVCQDHPGYDASKVRKVPQFIRDQCKNTD